MVNRNNLMLSGHTMSPPSRAHYPLMVQATQQTGRLQQIGLQLVARDNSRKLKARLAARARRSQEASVIAEIANELLLTQEEVKKIDKATIVKLAIDYIKAFETLCKFQRAQSFTSGASSCGGYGDTSCGGSTMYGSNISEFGTKLITSSVFSPRTEDVDSHFLVIGEGSDGTPLFVLKPDTEIAEDEDLTHLAPLASDVIIPLDGDLIERPFYFCDVQKNVRIGCLDTNCHNDTTELF